MKTIFHCLALMAMCTGIYAQTAESLKLRIQEHYRAINSDNDEQVVSHHLEDFSIFPWNGSTLVESGYQQTVENMGFQYVGPETNVIMQHFNAQIYDNVGLATFYLYGNYGEATGLWRVSAVWVWENGNWKEAHHHESRLIN